MLSLTRKADYALVAAVHLARQRELAAGPVSAREIAEQFDLPLPLLMNVLKQLAGAGLLSSTRGASGGYTLIPTPAALTVFDVVDAVADTDADEADEVAADTGPGAVPETALGGDDATDEAPGDTGTAALARLRHRLNAFLQQMTLADLLREADESGGDTIVPLRTARRPAGP